jgi:hypothetical protein
VLLEAKDMRHNTDHQTEAFPAGDKMRCPLRWEMKPDMHEIAQGLNNIQRNAKQLR